MTLSFLIAMENSKCGIVFEEDLAFRERSISSPVRENDWRMQGTSASPQHRRYEYHRNNNSGESFEEENSVDSDSRKRRHFENRYGSGMTSSHADKD